LLREMNDPGLAVSSGDRAMPVCLCCQELGIYHVKLALGLHE